MISVEIELSYEKSPGENAAEYFEKAKKAKRKLESLKHAIEETKKTIAQLEKHDFTEKKTAKKAKKQWFHAFHWFLSSNSFLVVAGKDAKTNELLVKKHLGEGDKFFHADVHGASACIIKSDGKEIPEQTLQEAAVFAAVFSKAWKQGAASVDVFAVESKQVSKKAPSGESLGTGAFMIYGKRQWFRKTPLELWVGVRKDGGIVSGSEHAIKKQCIAFVKILQGSNDSAKTAKAIIAAFEKKLGKLGISANELVAMLPGSSMQLVQ